MNTFVFSKSCVVCQNLLHKYQFDNLIFVEDNPEELRGRGLVAVPAVILGDGRTLYGFDNVKENMTDKDFDDEIPF